MIDNTDKKLYIVKTKNLQKRKEVEQALKDNNGYCPCRLSKTEDTKRMCKEFREQTTTGECHCGLYCKYHKIIIK